MRALFYLIKSPLYKNTQGAHTCHTQATELVTGSMNGDKPHL